MTPRLLRATTACAFLLGTGLSAFAQAPVAPPEPTPPSPAAATPAPETHSEVLRGLLASARTGDAVRHCDQLFATSPEALAPDLKRLCARAHVAHGDRLYALGSLTQAKGTWQSALSLDPTLSDDRAFALRQNALNTQSALQPLTPLPTEPQQAAPSPPLCPPAPPVPVCPRCPTCPEQPAPSVEAAAEQEAPPGPRAERGIGAGLGLGYDGLASVVLSWMHEEYLSLEASVGLIFPTLDARLKVYGSRTPLTPVFGVGMLTPFGVEDHYGAEIDAGFPALYGHGTIVHLDVGLSYAPLPLIDIYAGASFLTSLDAEVEILVFFPHWAFQTILYF